MGVIFDTRRKEMRRRDKGEKKITAELIPLVCMCHHPHLHPRLVHTLGLRTGLCYEYIHGREGEKKLGDVEKEPVEKQVLDEGRL